ncbi:MAG: cell wall synthesis protein CwsA [Microthrixaceae bacterium]
MIGDEASPDPAGTPGDPQKPGFGHPVTARQGSGYIHAFEVEQQARRDRRRTRRRVTWIVAGGLTTAAVLIGSVAWILSTRATDRTEVPSTAPPTTAVHPTTTSDREPTTSLDARTAPTECDLDAISSALADAPEPQEIDGTPFCAETFWLVPIATTATGEKLTVLLRPGDTPPETVAVVARQDCPVLSADEPSVEPELCPA